MREPLIPVSPLAVLTEAGQPCRFPFRYGGRMVHSCTTEGNAHRKWWVPVPVPRARPGDASAPCPPYSTLSLAHSRCSE